MLNLYIRVLVICAYHLIANCVCETIILWLVLRREQSVQYDIVSSRVKKKTRKEPRENCRRVLTLSVR